MTTYTEQEAKAIRPKTWALNTNDGTSIIRAYSKENAVLAANQRHPRMNVVSDDLYPSSTIVSDCCDEMVRVDAGWNRDKGCYEEEFAFKLSN